MFKNTRAYTIYQNCLLSCDHTSSSHWTNMHVSSSKVWLQKTKHGWMAKRDELSFCTFGQHCDSVSSADNNDTKYLSASSSCCPSQSVSVRFYLRTEWWFYRKCRSWHHGQSRCPEGRAHKKRSPGLDWMSPAYTENTPTYRQLLV